MEEIPEVDEIYGIMNHRIMYNKNVCALDIFYGPPDICYLVKETHKKGFLGMGSKKVSKIGAYHYIYGLDTSNIACISAYISKYIQKSTNSNYKIVQSIFCVYDFFMEKDLRLLIKFPGGIKKIFYIDDQQAIEANINELRTVYLSTILRSWNLNQVNSNSIYLEELSNIDSFNYMIESINYIMQGSLVFNILK